tara:strand:- start:835 stop:1299 length:465 start_codon:yes stop_codon:yes gene_type:complete
MVRGRHASRALHALAPPFAPPASPPSLACPLVRSTSLNGLDGEPNSPLTPTSFRMKADKQRSFTGSAPPGARPPLEQGAPRSVSMLEAPSTLLVPELDMDMDMERRQETGSPMARPPISPERAASFDMLASMRDGAQADDGDLYQRPPRRPPRR